jgi:hypothetical protein
MLRLVVVGLRDSVRAWLVVSVAASLTACEGLYPAAIEGLDQPESMTVYLLAPDEAANTDDVAERVQGIPVRRKVVVRDRDARHHLVSELTLAMNERAEAAACWKPHYAVRAREGRRSFEILFSFECNSMSVAGEASPRPISTRAQLAVTSVLSEGASE